MLRLNKHSASAIQSLRIQRIAATAIVAIILIALYWNKLFTYSLGGDDYSLIESARSFDLNGWLFSGFSDYFYVFDGSLPYANFIRPVVNIVFWINNLLFPERPGFYFLSTILFVSFYCYSLLCLSGSRMLGILLISLFCIASPSIAQSALGSPPFAFDVLAAAFVIAAINTSLRGKSHISICLLFLAVFTKEIGLAACIAFAIHSAIRPIADDHCSKVPRLSGWTIGYLAPVAIYAIIRYIGVGMGGTYSTNNIGIYSLITRAVSFPIKFPMGLAAHLSVYRDLLLSGNLIGFIIRFAPLLTNLIVFTGSVFLVARYAIKQARTRRNPLSSANIFSDNNILILWVLFTTSLYLCLMGADGRFYPLPQGCLLVLLVRAIDYELINKYILRIAAFSLLAVYSFLFISHAKSALAYKPSNVDKILESVVSKAKESQAKKILLVNAPDIYSSPRYIERYYQFNGDLDFLYNSRGSCEPYPQYTLLRKNEDPRFAYEIRPSLGKTLALPSQGCDPEIAFNGYSIRQSEGPDKDGNNFVVSGNEFRYFPAKKGGAKTLRSIGISRHYDAIYVADYKTGEVKLLSPVIRGS